MLVPGPVLSSINKSAKMSMVTTVRKKIDVVSELIQDEIENLIGLMNIK